MGGLVRIFLALCGVCEAEGRALRRNSLLLVKKGGFVFLGICFLGAGLALLLAALYLLLSIFLADWLVLALVGTAALFCAFWLLRTGWPETPADDAGEPAAGKGRPASKESGGAPAPAEPDAGAKPASGEEATG